MRESYLARARQRLEQVQQTEEAAAEEALDRLDRKLEQTMRAVEASYEKNKERWVDTLFSPDRGRTAVKNAEMTYGALSAKIRALYGKRLRADDFARLAGLKK